MILQRCNLPFVLSRAFKTFFQNTTDFIENLEMMQTVGGGIGWGKSCNLCHFDALHAKINIWVTPQFKHIQ